MNRFVAVGFLCLSIAELASAQMTALPGLPTSCIPLGIKRQWQPPVVLFSGMMPNSQPDVAASSSGEAMAVYLGMGTLGRTILYARRYTPPAFTPGVGVWYSPVVLDFSIYGISDPRVAVDDKGNALIVWETSSSAAQELRASYYDRSRDSFSSFVTLSTSTSTGVTAMPSVAMSGAAGDGMVVFQRQFLNFPQVFARRFVKATMSWTGAVQVNSSLHSVPRGTYPKVKMDNAGRAMAAWTQGSASVLWGARFTPEGGWSSVLIGGNTVTDPNDPQHLGPEETTSLDVALNPVGVGFLGWIQSSSPTTPSIRALRINTASPINTNPSTNPSVIVNRSLPESPSDLHLSVDDAGSLGLVFLGKQPGGSTIRSAFAFQVSANGTITPSLGQPPITLDALPGDSSDLSFGFDSSGNGIATWLQPNIGISSLFAVHLTHAPRTLSCGEQWLWASPILAENSTEIALRARTAVFRFGAGIAVWTAGSPNGSTIVPTKVFAALYQ